MLQEVPTTLSFQFEPYAVTIQLYFSRDVAATASASQMLATTHQNIFNNFLSLHLYGYILAEKVARAAPILEELSERLGHFVLYSFIGFYFAPEAWDLMKVRARKRPNLSSQHQRRLRALLATRPRGECCCRRSFLEGEGP